MLYEKLNTGNGGDMELYLCARDDNLAPGVRYGPVIRDIYIVECCTGGYGSVIINGTEFPIKSGDCYILFPGDIIVHTASEKEPRRGVWCAVDGIRIASYLKRAGITSCQPFAPKEAFQGITRQIDKMIDLKSDADSGANLRRQSCVYGLFGELLRYSKPASDTDSYIEKALHVIEAKYDRIESVSEIASDIGLERSYFSTLFKAATGASPYRYLSDVRIKKACAIMASGRCKISGVAKAVGIPPENFSRIFKRYTGKTPVEYMKSQEKL